MMPPIAKAALWMTGTLVSFVAMAVSGRELAAELSTLQILFWRSLAGLVIAAVLLTRQGWAQVRSAQLKVQIGRNLVHFGGQFGWFYGIAFIPLAEVFAIEFTTPIWTMLLAAAFLGERVTRARVLAIALGFAGVLVVLRPGLTILHPILHPAAFAVLGAAFVTLAPTP